MKRKLIVTLALLLTLGACSDKKKSNPIPPKGSSEQSSGKDASKKGESKDSLMAKESEDQTENEEDTVVTVSEKPLSPIPHENEDGMKKFNEDEYVEGELEKDIIAEKDLTTTTKRPNVDPIQYEDDGQARLHEGFEEFWLDKYAKSSGALTKVLTGYDDFTDSSELIVVRTNTTPDRVKVKMKANKLLKEMELTYSQYVDYLDWKAGDCEEAYNSIIDFAKRYNFEIKSQFYTYDSDCNCSKIDTTKRIEVVELLKIQRASGWECPDNYISFKTCMDLTGNMKKYDHITLNFRDAKKLVEGEYELYRVVIKQKKLGSKKLIFEVTPLENSYGENLEEIYDVKGNKRKFRLGTINE